MLFLLYCHIVYFHMIFIYSAFHILYFSYAFHLLYLSYTFRVIDTLFLVLVSLSYTFLFHLLYCSYTFHVLYFSYTVILYFTSCSCNRLYFHRIVVLCFSYHVISYTFHIHLYFLILSIIYFVLSYTFCALEVPVGTTEINQRYIQIFTFILYSESYHIFV